MNLRICLICGEIWDDESNRQECYQCKMNKRDFFKTRNLGTVILQLRRANLLHHGKLK